MTVDIHTPIRAECLLPADEGWERPRGAEVQEVVRRIGLSGRALAVLGLSEHGGRRGQALDKRRNARPLYSVGNSLRYGGLGHDLAWQNTRIGIEWHG